MKRLLIAALAPLLFLTAGCVKQDAVKFHELENVSVSLGSTAVINASAILENTSCKNIKIYGILFHITDIYNNSIGELIVKENITIPRKAVSSVNISIRIRLTNPIAGIAILNDLEKNLSKLKVTGGAVVGSGMFKKNFNVENMPLSEFLSIFGANLEGIQSSVVF